MDGGRDAGHRRRQKAGRGRRNHDATPGGHHDPGSGITIVEADRCATTAQGYGGDQPAAAGRIQKSDFLRQDGAVTDPCPGPKLDQGYAGEAGPDKVLPEAPYAALLPALAVAVLAGGVALRRRRRPVEAARAVR